MNKVVVEWTTDKDGDLAIKANGKWYGFTVYVHPSEFYAEDFAEGACIYSPFNDAEVEKLGLDNCKVETYTFKEEV